MSYKTEATIPNSKDFVANSSKLLDPCIWISKGSGIYPVMIDGTRLESGAEDADGVSILLTLPQGAIADGYRSE